MTLDELFARCIPEPNSGCWLWKGTSTKGYGLLRYGGKKSMMLAHRVAYELAYGAIPAKTLVCHRCDTPACCNPEHLFLGTYRVNMRNAVAKGRALLGVRNGRAKLTEAQIIAIRADPRFQKQIALDYGVSQQQVCNIKARRSWGATC